MTEPSGFRVADADRVARVLDRLARRIHVELEGGVHLVGILRRGEPLARELGRRLAELRGEDVEVGSLRPKRYADDLTLLHEEPELEREEPLPYARFVGMHLDVGDGSVIEVHAPPYEEEWAVHLFHQSDLRNEDEAP